MISDYERDHKIIEETLSNGLQNLPIQKAIYSIKLLGLYGLMGDQDE